MTRALFWAKEPHITSPQPAKIVYQVQWDLHYRGNSNAYIVRDSHYIGENLYCAGARYSAGEVACTIPALYRDHYCTWYY